jgi:hypothetical protein
LIPLALTVLQSPGGVPGFLAAVACWGVRVNLYNLHAVRVILMPMTSGKNKILCSIFALSSSSSAVICYCVFAMEFPEISFET